MDKQKQPNDGADFEENLRQILTSRSIPENTGMTLDGGKEATVNVIKPTRKLLETASRIEEEQKKLFWFKLLRPLAFLALVALLAGFVYRITTFGTP